MTPPRPRTSPGGAPDAVEARLKEKLKSIHQQRERLAETIGEQLIATMVQYKREDQRLVDEYGQLLSQLPARFAGPANPSRRPEPCASVPDRFYFGGAGMAIVVYPSEERFNAPPTRETRPATSRPASPRRDSLPLTSLSSARAPSEPELPVLEPEHTVAPLGGKQPARPDRSSPDELAPGLSPSPRRRQRKRRASDQKAESTPKFLSTSMPVPNARATGAARPKSNSTRFRIVRCIQCARRKVKCDKGKPCLRCVRIGLAEECTYAQERVDTDM